MGTFTVGEKVVAVSSYMYSLTEGKEYEVITVHEPVHEPHFTWPEYVTVIGDWGTPITGHAHRFRRKDATAG